MKQNRKKLVRKFIAKLNGEIQELRDYYNRLLKNKYIDDKQNCRLNLIKLDVVEKIFCNEEFYGEMYSEDNYVISNHLLNLLCIRDLSTAADLMDSVYMSTKLAIPKNFSFNLLTPLERGMLNDQFKENNNERKRN